MDDEYGPSRKRGPSRKLLAARYDGDILLESCLIEYMIHRFVWGKEAKSQEARQKRKKRNGGRPSILVIASAECFVVASHIGINCAASSEFVMKKSRTKWYLLTHDMSYWQPSRTFS